LEQKHNPTTEESKKPENIYKKICQFNTSIITSIATLIITIFAMYHHHDDHHPYVDYSTPSA
jgi:fumarate reductase subunit D